MGKKLRVCMRLAIVIAMLFGSSVSFAQGNRQSEKKEVPQAVLEHIKKNKQKLDVTDADIAELELSSETDSKKSGVKHYYIKQLYNGVEIHGAITNMSVSKEGDLLNMGNRFHKEIGKKATGNPPALDAAGAVAAAAKHLGISVKESLTVLERGNGRNKEVLFSNGGISIEPIPAKLVYQPLEDGSLRLAWEVSIYELDAQNWWNIRLDASTGKVLDKDNMVVHCQFDNDGPEGKFLHDSHSHNLMSANVAAPQAKTSMLAATNVFNVYPMPGESPSHVSRTLVSTSAANATASPKGWNYTPLGDLTTTRGNNVYAYEDPTNNNPNPTAANNYTVNNYSPNGGADMLFDYPIDFTKEPDTYKDAAITNLYYWNNLIHDVWYQYGFDEISGNFQFDNFGKGGLGTDFVRAEAQDSRIGLNPQRNNANFSTPADGSRPRMQMYLWDGIPDQDMFKVTSPVSIAGSYAAKQASFGPRLSSSPLTGKVVLAEGVGGASTNPNEGCGAFTNTAEIAGNIAVIYRGSCEFGLKVYNAQMAGAIAAVIINNVSGDPAGMAAGTYGGLVQIPSVMVSDVTGATIVQQLNNNQQVDIALKDDGSGPELDGDFDNGIIVHEYGHGISNRLTGGPNTTGCLGNAEQMGEGWSDWFAMMMTMKAGDTPEKIRGMGTYASGQPTTGKGIRPAPYSTDFSINNFTYAATNNTASISQPHGIGFVWATMLWDMTWDLIGKYGFDEDLYNGKGGNNMAMQLVIDGLKMQKCSPGFVDGREAVLMADRVNYGGANQELIWKAFAKRGLGVNASQGSNQSRTDQVENFDLPSSYLCSIPVTISAKQSAGAYTGGLPTTLYLGYGPQSVVVTASGDGSNVYTWKDASGVDQLNGASYTFNATTAGAFTLTVKAVNSDMCTKYESITINVVDVRCGDNKKKDKILMCVDGETKCVDYKAVNQLLTKATGKLGDCSLNITMPAAAVTNAAVQKEADDFVVSYPNPFSESTTIRFKAVESGYTLLKVYDITGREVETLFEGNVQSGDTHTYTFSGANRSNGIYVYKIVNGSIARSGTMLLMK